jgi:hypothetical protein
MVEIDYIAHMLLQDTARCMHTDPRIVSQSGVVKEPRAQ